MGKKKKNKQLKSIDGNSVSEEMIDSWRSSLNKNEWPDGWSNVGETVDGKLPSYNQQTTLSFKAPMSLKMAAERQAAEKEMSLSAFIRSALEKEIVASR